MLTIKIVLVKRVILNGASGLDLAKDPHARGALAKLAIKAFCKGFWFRLDQLRATQTTRHLVGLVSAFVTLPLVAKAISHSV